jgi:hypothetical protein
MLNNSIKTVKFSVAQYSDNGIEPVFSSEFDMDYLDNDNKNKENKFSFTDNLKKIITKTSDILQSTLCNNSFINYNNSNQDYSSNQNSNSEQDFNSSQDYCSNHDYNFYQNYNHISNNYNDNEKLCEKFLKEIEGWNRLRRIGLE